MTHLLVVVCSLAVFFLSTIFSSEGAQAAALGQNINQANTQSKAATSASSAVNVVVSAKTSSLGASYSIRESNDGVRTLKEFVNAAGVVFAVSWEGLGRPDFSQIFGEYYADYNNQYKAQLKGPHRNSLSVKADRIVVSNSGHGSFMMGLAYVPSLLPAGVAAEDLK